jgi:hypothetical protein
MASNITLAKRKLRDHARNGGNWRLKGLLEAALPTTQVSERAMAKAWPTNKSDYRMLSAESREHERYGQEKYLSYEEDSEGYRRLSDAANNSDFSEGGMGEKIIHSDKAIKRALAFEDSIANLNTLFREELFDTIIEGSRKQQIARDAATVFNVDRAKGDHPRGQDDAFAPDVAEGGAIQDDANNPDTVSWDATKFGQGARVTDELIDQGLVDVIEMQMEWLGRAGENKINRIWLTELLDNVDTANDVDASDEDNRGVASVNEGIHQIELDDEQPDTVVQHPTFTKTLFDTAESNAIIPFANEFGDDEGVRDRVAFPLLGLEGFRGSDGVYDPDGSNTWDYTGADETGAVVYDRDRIGLYIYRDLEMKDYDDPIRDLQGVNIRGQVDAVWHQPEAGARINYS